MNSRDVIDYQRVCKPQYSKLHHFDQFPTTASKPLLFLRPYWRCYFPNTQAIIFVVDSSDTDRLVVAKEEFHAILEEEELKGVVALIFANKQDLPGALDDAAITKALELHKSRNRQWAILKTSAIKGEGLFEGLDCGICKEERFAMGFVFGLVLILTFFGCVPSCASL